jgi:hypothetical protein
MAARVGRPERTETSTRARPDLMVGANETNARPFGAGFKVAHLDRNAHRSNERRASAADEDVHVTTSRGRHVTRDARGVMGLCFSLAAAARGDVPSSVRVFRDAPPARNPTRAS